jgi:hypothetical protein
LNLQTRKRLFARFLESWIARFTSRVLLRLARWTSRPGSHECGLLVALDERPLRRGARSPGVFRVAPVAVQFHRGAGGIALGGTASYAGFRCHAAISVRQRGELDWPYMETKLQPLAEMKGQPAIMAAFARLRRTCFLKIWNGGTHCARRPRTRHLRWALQICGAPPNSKRAPEMLAPSAMTAGRCAIPWGRMASCAAIGNRRARGLPIHAQLAKLPHQRTYSRGQDTSDRGCRPVRRLRV